jgi:hypothetical protein
MTPVSKPKRRPPVAATVEMRVTVARLRRAASAMGGLLSGAEVIR